MAQPVIDLAGRRILLAEDEFIVAQDIAAALQKEGADVVGPVSNVDNAMRLVETGDFDGAVLDVNLRGKMVFSVADVLIAMGIPLVFASGYDKSIIPPAYRHLPHLAKPVETAAIARALFGAPPHHR